MEELTEEVFAWRAGETDDAEEEGDEISLALLGPKPEPLLKGASVVLDRWGLLDHAYALWEAPDEDAMVRRDFRR